MYDKLFSKNGLSLERLRAFVEIVAAGSPTRAAKGDATRQSQYSRQLKELEEFFGTELYVKRNGRWALTKSGRLLQSVSNEHLAALADLHQRCAGETVSVRLGAGESLIQWRILPKLSEFRRRLPNTRFVLLNRRSEDIAAGLLSGEMEAGVLPEEELLRSLKNIELAPVEFRLFVPAGFLPCGQSLTEDKLLALPLALLEGRSATRDALEAWSSKTGVKPDIAVECSSLLQLAEVVRWGSAAAILPTEARSLFQEQVQDYPLSGFDQNARRIHLAWDIRAIRSRPAVVAAINTLSSLLAQGSDSSHWQSRA